MAYITSFHAIEECVKAGARGPLLVAKPGPRAKTAADMARRQGVRCDRVGTAELDRLAPGHRGIALVVEDGAEGASDGGLETYLEEVRNKKEALVVILDEVTDPHNYGAILRSCDQFGAGLVLTRNRRVARNSDIVARTSAGASAWVRQAETANLARSVKQLQEAGFWVYGADMDGEPAYNKDLSGKTAVIFGGEAGLSRLLREACDGLIAIPSRGRIDSLNVSVAAGIILYEISRPHALKTQTL